MSHPVTVAPTLEDVLARLADVAGHSRAVVLVEGASDRAALLALARRQHRDLSGVAVVAVGGGGLLRPRPRGAGAHAPGPGAGHV